MSLHEKGSAASMRRHDPARRKPVAKDCRDGLTWIVLSRSVVVRPHRGCATLRVFQDDRGQNIFTSFAWHRTASHTPIASHVRSMMSIQSTPNPKTACADSMAMARMIESHSAGFLPMKHIMAKAGRKSSRACKTGLAWEIMIFTR